MKQRTRWKLLGCLLASAVFGGLTSQCSGDCECTDAGPDAGADATSKDSTSADAPSDVQTADVKTCPLYDGSTPYCLARLAVCKACNGAANWSPCELANFDTLCEKRAAYFSQAYVTNMATKCTSCSASCVIDWLADAGLTDAQANVVTDYCTKCPGDAGVCATFAHDTNLAEYSDSIAKQIDSKCNPDASAACNLIQYLTCEQTITNAVLTCP